MAFPTAAAPTLYPPLITRQEKREGDRPQASRTCGDNGAPRPASAVDPSSSSCAALADRVGMGAGGRLPCSSCSQPAATAPDPPPQPPRQPWKVAAFVRRRPMCFFFVEVQQHSSRRCTADHRSVCFFRCSNPSADAMDRVKMIDLISAIKELSEMLKVSESFVLQCKAQDGGP